LSIVIPGLAASYKKIDEHALKRTSSTMTDTIRRCMKIGHALQACDTWWHRGGG
jgi:hypothetical protein